MGDLTTKILFNVSLEAKVDLSHLGAVIPLRDIRGRASTLFGRLELDAGASEIGDLRLLNVEAERRGDFRVAWMVGKRQSATPKQLMNSQWLIATIYRKFGPTAEECGTQYDYRDYCPICGAGRKQISMMRLKAKTAHRTDFSVTFAGSEEIVVSQKAENLMTQIGITGVEYGEAEFVRIGRQKALQEPEPKKFQLFIDSEISLAPTTRNFLDFWGEKLTLCPLGNTFLGGEPPQVFLAATMPSGADVNVSKERFGELHFVGDSRKPSRFIVVSRKFYKMYRANSLTGMTFEAPSTIEL